MAIQNILATIIKNSEYGLYIYSSEALAVKGPSSVLGIWQYSWDGCFSLSLDISAARPPWFTRNHSFLAGRHRFSHGKFNQTDASIIAPHKLSTLIG